MPGGPTAFQPTAFQNNAFQIETGVPVPVPEGIDCNLWASRNRLTYQGTKARYLGTKAVYQGDKTERCPD